jgi:MarR family transcriptional regulator, 2-MHQ and catechol-resistance regulon repressor
VPTHYIGDEGTRRALDAFIKHSRARKTLSQLTGRLLAEYGLTESQLGTLEALYHLGPMCQSEIGRKILVSDGNVTMVINNLEKRGLISRQRHEQDRRLMMVCLTEKGQELIKELFPKHARNIVDLMSILTPLEQEQLGHLCKMLGQQARTDGNAGLEALHEEAAAHGS